MLGSTRKAIREVIEELATTPLRHLEAAQLNTYYDHRLSLSVAKNKILVPYELEYLLCETGPGNLRFDSRFIKIFIKRDIYVSQVYERLDVQEIVSKKLAAQKYIQNIHVSKLNIELVLRHIRTYVPDIRADESCSEPIAYGTFRGVPIGILILNGEWIHPDSRVFEFLKDCQERNVLPILIAKKISGILFPVFKQIAAFGLNLHRMYLPSEAKDVIEFPIVNEDFQHLKYKGQFLFGDELDTSLETFFESILPTHILDFYENFSNLKFSISDNFPETVARFKKNKLTRQLVSQYEFTEKVIRSLK